MTDSSGMLERDAGCTHRITQVDGLQVVTEHVPGVRSLSLGAWIGTGSRHEDERSAGYAHFLEHLLFKGSDRVDAEQISRYFDGIGSDIDAATTREYTVVHARVLDRHAADSLGVLGEMVLRPALEPDDIDAERQVILEEIAMYEDSPSDVVHELADELVFAGHPLGRPIVGSADSIARSRPDELAQFHRSHYRPGNLVLSAAGAVEHDTFVEQVREHFLVERMGTASPDTASSPPSAHVPHAQLRHKETEQVHLVLAGRGIRRDDDRRYAVALLDTIFGSAPSSRLFLEVRERRGLAYSVYSYLSSHADTGQIGIYVGVRPDRVAEVLDVLRAELDRICAEPPSQAEVELAAGHLEGRMLLSLESTTVRGNRLGTSLVTGMPIEPLETTVERIRAVGRDDLLALARDLLAPDRLSLAVVADDVDAVRAAADTAGLLPVQRERAAS